jgi:small-conductance mechanosensitive channel
MSNRNRWTTFWTILITLFLLGMGFVGLVGAQDSGQATAVPEPTPVPTPAPTPAAGIDGNLSDTVSETVSEISWQNALEVAISMAVIFLAAFYGGKLLYVLLRRVANRTKYGLDNQLLEVIRPQISWFLLAIGFQFATARLDFLDDNIEQLLQTSYFMLYLLVILATVWRAGDFLVDWYITGNSEKMNQNLVTQIVPLLKRLAHFTLILIAAVIAAGYFGINVLAISAALGLSGFALALAAKDTITNIISGFVLMVSQPFKVGDRIDVASLGSWGEAVEIGIRSTNVLMRDNRLVTVPNSAIVDNTVVNYSMPDTTYRLQTDIGVGYGVDIPHISQMIKDTVAKVDGVLPDKNIDVWFTEFGDSSNTFRVRWWVNSYAEKRRSTHAVNTAIQQLSEQMPIDMPNPTYSLNNKVTFSEEGVQQIAEALKDPR